MQTASETARTEPAAPPEALRLPPPAEPATARALWPTFMRRTLAEEVVRPPASQPRQ